LKNKLLLIGLVCAAPLVLGTAAYLFGWAPGARGNYGELIAPRAVSLPPLDALRGKWVLVSTDAAACDAYCEKKLYYMRQIRRALGRDMERVERLWILTGKGAPKAGLLAAFDGTMVARSTNGVFETAFSAAGTPADHIYLVDPLGNVMMRFPRDPDASRMLKDLKHLLKYSRIG